MLLSIFAGKVNPALCTLKPVYTALLGKKVHCKKKMRCSITLLGSSTITVVKKIKDTPYNNRDCGAPQGVSPGCVWDEFSSSECHILYQT